MNYSLVFRNSLKDFPDLRSQSVYEMTDFLSYVDKSEPINQTDPPIRLYKKHGSRMRAGIIWTGPRLNARRLDNG